MSCQPSPVALRLWHDTQVRYGTRVTYAGIVGDANHQTRVSGHNCGALQESPLDGVDYADEYAHALDIHVGADRQLGDELVRLLVADPRTRYVIWQGVGYYGVSHGAPGTFDSFDHTEHVHWSGMPGTTFDTRPFYTGTDPTIDPDEADIMGAADDIQRDIRLSVQVTLAATAKMLDEHTAELRAKVTHAHSVTRRVIVEQVVQAVNRSLPGSERIDVEQVVAAIDAELDDGADDTNVDVRAIVDAALAELDPPS